MPFADAALYSKTKKAAGFAADYYSNISFTGRPILSGFEPIILYRWILENPMASQAGSIMWRGKVEADAQGVYTITARSSGYFRLEIDKKKVLEYDAAKPQNTAAIRLVKGIHSVALYYRPSISGRSIQLLWIRPGQKEQEIVPAFGLALD